MSLKNDAQRVAPPSDAVGTARRPRPSQLVVIVVVLVAMAAGTILAVALIGRDTSTGVPMTVPTSVSAADPGRGPGAGTACPPLLDGHPPQHVSRTWACPAP